MPLPIAAAAVAGTAARAAAGAGLGRLANALFGVQAATDLSERLLTAGFSHIPTFSHIVAVAVQGGPPSDLRRIWYLCASIAFGRMLRSPSVRGGAMQMVATWNVSDKSCAIELSSTVAKTMFVNDLGRPSDTRLGRAMLTGIAFALSSPAVVAFELVAGVPVAGPAPGAPFGGPMLSPKESPLAFIQLGPDQITIGSGWPGFLMSAAQNNVFRARPPFTVKGDLRSLGTPSTIAPISGTDAAGRLGRVLREAPFVIANTGRMNFIPFRLVQPFTARTPPLAGSPVTYGGPVTLPDDGRIVTTGEKFNRNVQPPKPWIDGTTRTSLLDLVAASLAEPCYLPEAPAATGNPLYASGQHVYAAGRSLQYGELARQVGNTVLPTTEAFPIPFPPDFRP